MVKTIVSLVVATLIVEVTIKLASKGYEAGSEQIHKFRNRKAIPAVA